MNGDVPFVRESETEYLITISDRNIMWRIPTEEIEGNPFGTHSVLYLLFYLYLLSPPSN
jgi:hypothetical protein